MAKRLQDARPRAVKMDGGVFSSIERVTLNTKRGIQMK
jgi:hypothetical protein